MQTNLKGMMAMQATIGQRAKGVLAAAFVVVGLALGTSLAASPGTASASHTGSVTCNLWKNSYGTRYATLQFSVSLSNFNLSVGTPYQWRAKVHFLNLRTGQNEVLSKHYTSSGVAAYPTIPRNNAYQSGWYIDPGDHAYPKIEVRYADGTWRGVYTPTVTAGTMFNDTRLITDGCYYPY